MVYNTFGLSILHQDLIVQQTENNIVSYIQLKRCIADLAYISSTLF